MTADTVHFTCIDDVTLDQFLVMRYGNDLKGLLYTMKSDPNTAKRFIQHVNRDMRGKQFKLIHLPFSKKMKIDGFTFESAK